MARRSSAQMAEPDLGSDQPRLVAEVGRRAHVVLVSLPEERIVSVSDGVSPLLGVPESEIIGRRPADLLVRPIPGSALNLLNHGYIDFYRAHLVTLPPHGTGVPIVAWIHACELGGKRFALVAIEERGRNFDALPVGMDLDLVLGIANRDWRITAMSGNTARALGVHASALVGRKLELGDRPRLRVVGSAIRRELASTDAVSVALRVLAPPELARHGVVAIVLMGAEDPRPASRFVVLARRPGWAVDAEAVRRVGELEEHLWRIAAEVEASGILFRLNSLPTTASIRGKDALTPRQWEVLRRLVVGQRVPTIAAELFISQSTVRNHLAAIFDRFGVHSQAQLLAELSKTSGLSSRRD